MAMAACWHNGNNSGGVHPALHCRFICFLPNIAEKLFGHLNDHSKYRDIYIDILINCVIVNTERELKEWGIWQSSYLHVTVVSFQYD